MALSSNRRPHLLRCPPFILILPLLLAAPVALGADAGPPPPTSISPVSDLYHGVTVAEDYRWLEDFDDPEVQNWNQSQNEYTRSYLNNLADRPPIKSCLEELRGSVSSDYYSLRYHNGVLFALKEQPPLEQPLLITLTSPEDPATETVVLNLNELDPEGNTAIDFYRPSRDGSLVAMSLSQFGSEDGTVRVYDVGMGVPLADAVKHVNGPTAGGDVAWKVDGSGFFYTRYPHPGERPEADLRFYQQVYYHELGSPGDSDRYAVGEEFPYIAEIQLDVSPDGQSFLATVANGDGGEYAHYLKSGDGDWRQITQFSDLIPRIKFGLDDALYVLSRKNAPRGQILRMPAGQTELSDAKVLVPESEVVIKDFLPTAELLYVTDLVGGPSQLRVFGLKGEAQPEIPFDQVASIKGLVHLGGDTVLFRSSRFTEPPAWYRFDPVAWTSERTWLYQTSPADFRDIEVVREFATSPDGTEVPINIIRRRDFQADGQNPTILYGYGGYGISMSSWFDATLRLWLDQGGVYVVANIRGGGEYGEEWHLAGNLTNKQNVFDDFAACARYLVESNVTNPDLLVLKGGSNGGLLMGAMVAQHPDICRAVYSRVGIYDMLRVELDPNGVFNITEFGTVKNPNHFKALHAYSPYHHVEDGVAYPAMMLQTGQHDGRVNPSQSRKMTARLQAATSSGHPILLRYSSKTGHGGGTALSEKIELEADIYAFILDQLDLRFKHDD